MRIPRDWKRLSVRRGTDTGSLELTFGQAEYVYRKPQKSFGCFLKCIALVEILSPVRAKALCKLR